MRPSNKPGPYTVILAGEYGRIWNSKPQCESTGLLSVVQNPKQRQHASQFTAVAFAPAADTLATVDTRGNVFAFHIKRNRYGILARAGHEGTAISFSSRHKRDLYVAFSDRTVRAYDVESAQLLATLRGHHSAVSSISVSSADDLLVTCSPDSVLLWDTKKWERKRTLGASSYGAVHACFLPVGTSLATGFRDDTVWVWDATSFALVKKLSAPLSGATGQLSRHFAVSSDGQTLVACGCSPLLLVWDIVADVLMYAVRLPNPATSATQVHFMPDNRTVAVASSTGSVEFVDVLSSRLTYRISAGAGVRACDRVDVDARGNYAALVSQDGQLRLYDLAVLRKHTNNHQELQRVEVASIKDSLLRSGVPMSSLPGGRSVLGGGPTVDGEPAGRMRDDPDLVLLENRNPNSAMVDSLFQTKRKRKVVWGSAPDSPVKAGAPNGSSRAGLADESSKPRSGPSLAAQKSSRVDPQEKTLSRGKLRQLLDAFGEYPEKHRLRIWRFLLDLPGNAEAHHALAARGHHAAFDSLAQRFPIKDRTMLTRLGRVLSQLAHWAPVFGEAEFLPAMAFPFTKLFGAEDRASFEVMVCVLINWARGWFEMFPAPPLRSLRAVEELVLHHDAPLHHAMMHVGRQMGVAGAAWLVLQTFFTEVLAKTEWLKLWDHLLSNNPNFIYFAAAAYLIHFRDILMAARGEQELTMLLTRNNPLNINKFIRSIYSLRQATPPDKMPKEYPLETLPKSDMYPVFQGFPKVAVDAARLERERLLEAETNLLNRKQVIAQLQKQTEELETQQAVWEHEKGRLSTIEEDRRARMRLEEDAMLQDRVRMDNLEKAERLRQIQAVEEAYRTNLVKQRESWRTDLERLRDDIEHKAKQNAYDAQSRMEDQSIKAMEFQAQRRLWSVEEEAAHAATMQRLNEEVAMRQKQEEFEIQKKEEQWRLEDGERHIRMQAEAERRTKAAALNEELWARQQAEELLLTDKLHRDVQMAEVEKQRHLRMLAEDEQMTMNQSVEAARARESLVAREEAAVLHSAAEHTRRWHESQQEARKETIVSEQALAARETEARAQRIAQIEREQKRREWESCLHDQRRLIERTNKEEERATRDVLDALEQERMRDRELEMELELKRSELVGRLEHADKAAEREEAVMHDERERFSRLREELSNRMCAQEGESRRRHEEVMARMALEREKKLMELDVVWRKRVQKEELMKLQQETATMEALRRERGRQYDAREQDLQTGVAALHASLAGDAPSGLGTEPAPAPAWRSRALSDSSSADDFDLTRGPSLTPLWEAGEGPGAGELEDTPLTSCLTGSTPGSSTDTGVSASTDASTLNTMNIKSHAAPSLTPSDTPSSNAIPLGERMGPPPPPAYASDGASSQQSSVAPRPDFSKNAYLKSLGEHPLLANSTLSATPASASGTASGTASGAGTTPSTGASGSVGIQSHDSSGQQSVSAQSAAAASLAQGGASGWGSNLLSRGAVPASVHSTGSIDLQPARPGMFGSGSASSDSGSEKGSQRSQGGGSNHSGRGSDHSGRPPRAPPTAFPAGQSTYSTATAQASEAYSATELYASEAANLAGSLRVPPIVTPPAPIIPTSSSNYTSSGGSWSAGQSGSYTGGSSTTYTTGSSSGTGTTGSSMPTGGPASAYHGYLGLDHKTPTAEFVRTLDSAFDTTRLGSAPSFGVQGIGNSEFTGAATASYTMANNQVSSLGLGGTISGMSGASGTSSNAQGGGILGSLGLGNFTATSGDGVGSAAYIPTLSSVLESAPPFGAGAGAPHLNASTSSGLWQGAATMGTDAGLGSSIFSGSSSLLYGTGTGLSYAPGSQVAVEDPVSNFACSTASALSYEGGSLPGVSSGDLDWSSSALLGVSSSLMNRTGAELSSAPFTTSSAFLSGSGAASGILASSNLVPGLGGVTLGGGVGGSWTTGANGIGTPLVSTMASNLGFGSGGMDAGSTMSESQLLGDINTSHNTGSGLSDSFLSHLRSSNLGGESAAGASVAVDGTSHWNNQFWDSGEDISMSQDSGQGS